MSSRQLDHSDWERETAGQDARIVRLAARVVAGSMAFFFGGFFFAFIYLRLQDVAGRWNHHDAKPSLPLAITILVASVTAAAILLSLRGSHRAHQLRSWRARGLIVELLIVVAIVARVIQLWTLGLDPSSAGFVAVLIGWSGALLAVDIGALYWCQTLVARAGRLARTEAAERGDASADQDLTDAEVRFNASATGFTLVWMVLTCVEILAFVLLDVVR